MTSVASARARRVLESMEPFFRAIGDLDSTLPSGACNFIAGNPQELASSTYVETLQRWAKPQDKDWYGYKGPHAPAREAAAESVSKELGIEFDASGIVLARGAHGAMSGAMFATLDPGDEVVYVSPPWFFYEAMILAAGGVPVKTYLTPDTFDLDLDHVASVVGPRTRMMILNTPHNPTGRIFPAPALKTLAGLLEEASGRNGRPIYLLSDEAYSRILFDGNKMVTPATFYPYTLCVHTYSKSALAPGQRVGFLAVPPHLPGREELVAAIDGMSFGTANGSPDAIMQYALADIDAMSIDLGHLQAKRDRMIAALREFGYSLHVPEATFYLLVKAPVEDDVAFCKYLQERRVYVLSGQAVEKPGYFRISLTATDDMIDRALPVFEEAFSAF